MSSPKRLLPRWSVCERTTRRHGHPPSVGHETGRARGNVGPGAKFSVSELASLFDRGGSALILQLGFYLGHKHLATRVLPLESEDAAGESNGAQGECNSAARIRGSI